LANQVAASLKLQERQTMREQLFRSESCGDGTVISGVASELREPLDQHSAALDFAGGVFIAVADQGHTLPERDLRLRAASRSGAEIVSTAGRLAHPEDSQARIVDINACWRTHAFSRTGMEDARAADPEPAGSGTGSRTRIGEPARTSISEPAGSCGTERRGGNDENDWSREQRDCQRAVIEISYSLVRDEGEPVIEEDPFAENAAGNEGALGLGVCKGIIRSHGGEIQFRSRGGSARIRNRSAAWPRRRALGKSGFRKAGPGVSR